MSLFVGNLSSRINQEDLEKLFFDYGKCRINKRHNYAFIDFFNEEDAVAAIKNLSKINLRGQSINIEWSKKSKNYRKSSNSQDFIQKVNYKETYEYDYEIDISNREKYALRPYKN